MTLTLRAASRLLKERGLLREIVDGARWTIDEDQVDDMEFSSISYDSRTVDADTLLFCKGRFRDDYLRAADGRGLRCYVAEHEHGAVTRAVGLVVTDVRKAMSLLSAEFYGRPQDSLTVVGITGTKGKTTTAYFTQAILNAHSGGRCALFSSVDNCLDGHTYEESELTTPESLDAFRMMRQAVDNGMRYLVMEVSSQAYKVSRVHGLVFDVGAFLNISPDHISPIEHPDFEDYLYCKRQIVANSRRMVVGAGCDHADLVVQDARVAGVPVDFFALAGDGAALPDFVDPARCVTARPADGGHTAFDISAGRTPLGSFSLSLDGDFNYANAAAAVAIALAAGVDVRESDALHAMEGTKVSGRMERFDAPEGGTTVIVDYAHNHTSVCELLNYVDARFGAEHPRVTLVTGAAGDKAYDRRREIVEAAQERIARFVFTAEDTDTEPYEDICNDMLSYVSDPHVEHDVIVDRVSAITDAVDRARAHSGGYDVVLVIGKGHERWIKDRNRHVPYEGDDRVVSRLLER